MANETTLRGLWRYKDAKKKCSEKYSCCIEIEAEERLSLSPYFIGRIKRGVQEDIARKIRHWKFNENYGGIIVAYGNIRVFQRSAEIHPETGFLLFNIKINYIVFKPEVGKKLVGVVCQTTPTHVGCLVHDVFNASLDAPIGQNDWPGRRLAIGNKFVFRVREIETVAGVLLIAGKIKDKDVKYLNKYLGNPNSVEDNSSTVSESVVEISNVCHKKGIALSNQGSDEEHELQRNHKSFDKGKKRHYNSDKSNDHLAFESDSKQPAQTVVKNMKKKKNPAK